MAGWLASYGDTLCGVFIVAACTIWLGIAILRDLRDLVSRNQRKSGGI